MMRPREGAVAQHNCNVCTHLRYRDEDWHLLSDDFSSESHIKLVVNVDRRVDPFPFLVLQLRIQNGAYESDISSRVAEVLEAELKHSVDVAKHQIKWEGCRRPLRLVSCCVMDARSNELHLVLEWGTVLEARGNDLHSGMECGTLEAEVSGILGESK